jgi:hypothetical protein
MPRGVKLALGPERDLLIARLACEADTFGDEAFADAVAAGGGLDVEQVYSTKISCLSQLSVENVRIGTPRTVDGDRVGQQVHLLIFGVKF